MCRSLYARERGAPMHQHVPFFTGGHWMPTRRAAMTSEAGYPRYDAFHRDRAREYQPNAGAF